MGGQPAVPLRTNMRKSWYSYYTLDNLFRKSSVQVNVSGAHSLKKCLNLLDVISFGVGSTLGSGVFVTISVIIQSAGPAVTLSFIFAAIASLLSGFCYAEFATRLPVSGSAYTFAYVSMGELIGWLIGWNLTLEYAISASVVARSWSSYVQQIFTTFGVSTPDWLFGYVVNDYISIAPMSIVIVIICFIFLMLGAKDSSKLNIGMTVLNIATLVFVIILAAVHTDTKNWDPYFPHELTGAFAGSGIAFFSYIGFDSVTTLAEEMKNPQRDLPLGIVGTLVIATFVYIGVGLTLTGIINFELLTPDQQTTYKNAPIAYAFQLLNLMWAAKIVAIATVIALSATTLCSLLGQPRIFFQMAKDGLLPAKFMSVNAKQTPVFGTVVTCVVAAVIGALFNVDTLSRMISIGTLLAFTIVCAGVIVLRKKSAERPYFTPVLLMVFSVFSFIFSFGVVEKWPLSVVIVFGVLVVITYGAIHLQPTTFLPETFQCPFVPATPCIAIFFNIYLIVGLSLEAIIRAAVWSLIGILIYLIYGIRNSKLNQFDETDIYDADSYDVPAE